MMVYRLRLPKVTLKQRILQGHKAGRSQYPVKVTLAGKVDTDPRRD